MLALIPARGGSKRIPGKNIRLIENRPLISFPIQVLADNDLVSELFVSSDSDEILSISNSWSAKTVRRDSRLSDDLTGLLDVVKDFISRELTTYPRSERLICVLPTALDLSDRILTRATEASLKHPDSIVMAAKQFSHPIERAMVRTEAGTLAPLCNPENMLARTQDLEPKYFDAGMFYLASLHTWQNSESILGGGVVPVTLAPEIGIDIDTEADLDFATLLYKAKKLQ